MLTRWDPFAEFARFHGGVVVGSPRSRPFAPAVDIIEEEDAILLSADVPGVAAGDVEVHLENRVLTFRGQRSRTVEEERRGYRRRERSYGRFSRSFTLPDNVDVDGIDAHLAEGVLRMRLPKRSDSTPRSIPVTSLEESHEVKSETER